MNKNSTASNTAGALRLQAYRQRLRAEELCRVEILLPKETRTAVRQIAQREGTRYLETVSALAQLGLETYNKQITPERSVSAAEQRSLLRTVPEAQFAALNYAASFSNTCATSAIGEIDALTPMTVDENDKDHSPLARFLKSRKGGLT